MKKKVIQKDLEGKSVKILNTRIDKWEKEYYDFTSDLLDLHLSRITHSIHKLLKRTIKLEYHYSFSNQRKKEFPIGKSKLGGYPDIPHDFEWPFWKNEPLDFILQLNLKQLANLKGCQFIKKEGMLYFFYHFKSKFKDYESKDKERWRVIYHPSTNELRKVESLPYKHLSVGDLYPISFKEQISIPSPSAIDNNPSMTGLHPYIIDTLKLNDKEEKKYKNLYYKCRGDQLFGYPSYEHGNMQLECELLYNNLSPKDYSWRKHSFTKTVSWTLLMTIHDKPYSGWDFGDGTVVNFWIREEDLQKNNFDDVWSIIQYLKD